MRPPTTQYVLDTTIHKQTNNVNKTCALLQTICVRHHYTQTNVNNVNKTQTSYKQYVLDTTIHKQT